MIVSGSMSALGSEVAYSKLVYLGRLASWEQTLRLTERWQL